MKKAFKGTVKVAAAIFIRKGEVLLTSRTDRKSGELFWEFPGGKIEPGETVAEAMAREIREELGAETLVFDQIYHIVHEYPDICVELHFLRCLFSCDEPELVALDGQLIRWCPVSELCHENLLPADSPLAEFLGKANYL